MPIIETKIDKFDGGIVNDPRDSRENVARIISNFDILTNPRKMSPYRDSEDGDTDSNNKRIRNFAIALRTGTTYSLYGLGVTTGAGVAEVYYKNLTDTSTNDLGDGGFTETLNNASASGAANFDLFVYYALQGRIYGAKANVIWAYDPAGSATFAEGGTGESLNVTYTSIAQGLVHSKDDILYVPYDNKIARNNAGTWTATVLTIPTHYVISSICEFGNFIAIAAAPIAGIGNSRVYLWDRDSSLVTLSESIDWGEGVIKILEEVDGELIGISQIGGAATGSIPLIATASFADKVIFRRLVGTRAIKFLTLIGGSDTTVLPIAKQKANQRLYFMMIVTLNGALREGVWSIGRPTIDSPFVLVHERTPNNATALTSPILYNFILAEDYLLQSYNDTAVFEMSKTIDTATFTSQIAIYESQIFDGRRKGFDASYYKKLKEISVTTEFLPAAGDVRMRYRTDANIPSGSWTTIFTNTTDNSISRTGINIASTGAELPDDYKEIQFRIESLGNAEITGLIFKEEIKPKRYDTA